MSWSRCASAAACSGSSLGKHVTQSGFYDDGSESVKASVLADEVYGRDRSSHIIAMYTAPEGKTVDDPEWSKKIVDKLDKNVADHPDQMLPWAGYLKAPTPKLSASSPPTTRPRTFVTLPLKGDNDDEILNNFKTSSPICRTSTTSRWSSPGCNRWPAS